MVANFNVKREIKSPKLTDIIGENLIFHWFDALLNKPTLGVCSTVYNTSMENWVFFFIFAIRNGKLMRDVFFVSFYQDFTQKQAVRSFTTAFFYWAKFNVTVDLNRKKRVNSDGIPVDQWNCTYIRLCCLILYYIYNARNHEWQLKTTIFFYRKGFNIWQSRIRFHCGSSSRLTFRTKTVTIRKWGFVVNVRLFSEAVPPVNIIIGDCLFKTKI